MARQRGTRSCYVGGCEHAECREANRRYHEELRRAAGVKPLPRGPQTPHGTAARYQHWKCRCESCRRAWANEYARMRVQRAARLATNTTVVHGRASTYLNHMCRCEPCTVAHSEDCKQRYQARKKAAA